MLKRITWLLIVIMLSVGFFSFRNKFFTFQPPPNRSGAPGGGLCSSCHGNLNSGGGAVSVTGLPANFQPGQTYPFSVTISHGIADRTRWGFAITARNSNNTGIGSFTSTNSNAATNGVPSEIAHYDAVVTSASNSYTYTNLSWTAPATITTGDNIVNFYIAGNAANNNGNTGGDFIYSNTLLAVLPITLKSIDYKIIDDYKVQVNWKTESESNSKEFILEKSDDNNRFYEVGRVAAAGNSQVEKAYSFTDNKPSFFNQSVYYRLKLVDMDGKPNYSKVIQVTLKAKATHVYSLSPNPAIDFLNAVIVSDQSTRVEVVIVSANGNIAARHILNLKKGNNTYRIPITSLQHGLYFFRLQAKEFTQNISFIAM